MIHSATVLLFRQNQRLLFFLVFSTNHLVRLTWTAQKHQKRHGPPSFSDHSEMCSNFTRFQLFESAVLYMVVIMTERLTDNTTMERSIIPWGMRTAVCLHFGRQCLQIIPNISAKGLFHLRDNHSALLVSRSLTKFAFPTKKWPKIRKIVVKWISSRDFLAHCDSVKS